MFRFAARFHSADALQLFSDYTTKRKRRKAVLKIQRLIRVFCFRRSLRLFIEAVEHHAERKHLSVMRNAHVSVRSAARRMLERPLPCPAVCLCDLGILSSMPRTPLQLFLIEMTSAAPAR